MRFINPYPYGAPPRSADLWAVIAAASRARLLDGEDRILAEVDRDALDALAPALEIREEERFFDERCHNANGLPPLRLVLEDEHGPMGRIDLYPPNGSVYFYGRDATAWCGWAELRAPSALLAWLASVGLPGPREDRARWESEEGKLARDAFRKAVPSNLRGAWCASTEALLDPWTVMEAAAWLDQAGANMKRAKGLLDLYGQGSGPFSRRPDYESLPQLLIGRFGYDEVARALAKPRSPHALAGAGRLLLHRGTSPATREAQKPLDPETREAMIEAVGQLASAEDAARLRALLFPSPLVTPAHTVLVGASWTNRFSQVVADGEAAFAIEGSALVRLEGGERIVLEDKIRLSFWPVPIAVREGRALVNKTGRSLEIDRTGKTVAIHPMATPEQVARARALTAEWPDPEGAGDGASILPRAPTREECAPLVTPEERAAFEAFAHLGLPEPPSVAWARRVLGCALEGASTALLLRGESSGSPRRVGLPGRLFRWTATEAHLVMALAAGETCRIAWLAKGDAVAQLSPELAVRPRALRSLLASESAVQLVVNTGAGEVVLRVSRAR